MSPKVLIPFLPFLKGVFNKVIIADIINSLTGNPIGKLIDRFTGKQEVTNNDNLGLNKRLMNLQRGGMGGVPTRGGALRFLGDGSGRLDDAPDIVPTNQSVLNNIAKNQGLAVSTTVPPVIDDKKVIVQGFVGLVGIIDQINKNIASIGNSLVETSAIEGAYRQELMDDLEESIAEKGKKRSKTRFERSVFNYVTRQQNKVKKITGNLTKDLSNALLLSIGMEVAANFMDSEEDTEIENPAKSVMDAKLEGAESSVDQLVEDGLDTGTAQVLTELSAIENTEGDSTLKGLNMPFSTSIPGVDDNFQGNSLMYFLLNQDIKKQLNNKKNEDNSGNNINPVSEDKDISQNISVNNSVASLPLDSMSGSTQIIDLRTAENLAGSGNDSGSAQSQLDTSVVNLEPSRGLSVYESFVRSV
tara:strand:+ start:36 stop:1280 length:1245 start_codon:yes stop_codon:yes gene_type:complete